MKARNIAIRIWRKRALNQARDSPKVASDRGEDGVGGVADATFEIGAAEMALGLHVADHGLVSGAALQFAFNGSDWHAARTDRREHGRWRNDEAFTLELVVRAGFVLADALGLRGREEMQLPAALALLLGSDSGATHQRLPINGLEIIHGRLVVYVT
jgi:hypothetical protein